MEKGVKNEFESQFLAVAETQAHIAIDLGKANKQKTTTTNPNRWKVFHSFQLDLKQIYKSATDCREM